MQFTVGKKYQITDAQGTSICFECRAVQFLVDPVMYPTPSDFVGFYSMHGSLRCADVIAGLANGCLALCVEVS